MESKMFLVIFLIIIIIVKIIFIKVNIIVGLERLFSCMKVVGLFMISFVFFNLINVMNKFILYCILILRVGGIVLVIFVFIFVSDSRRKSILF